MDIENDQPQDLCPKGRAVPPNQGTVNVLFRGGIHTHKSVFKWTFLISNNSVISFIPKDSNFIDGSS